jgi:hypothetical protein
LHVSGGCPTPSRVVRAGTARPSATATVDGELTIGDVTRPIADQILQPATVCKLLV